MATIDLDSLTNSTSEKDGTGVFDRMMDAIELRIEKQYNENRITGKEYAQVFLGSMQSTISESINFLLNEQKASRSAELLEAQILSETKNNEEGGVIDLQKEKITQEINSEIKVNEEGGTIDLQKTKLQEDTNLVLQNILTESKNNEDGGVVDLQKQKLQEEVDLVTAQTAGAHENVKSSQDATERDNQESAKRLLKTDAEISLIESKNAAQLAATTREDLESASKIALMEAQTDETLADTLRSDALNTQKVNSEIKNNEVGGVIDLQKEKLQQEVDLLGSRDLEQQASTLRQDNESTKKVLLMEAQTNGFHSDTKVKVLKQLYEGFSVGYSIGGDGTIPTGATAPSIDALTASVLSDIGTTGIITP